MVSMGRYKGDLNDIPLNEPNILTAWMVQTEALNKPMDSHGLLLNMYVDNTNYCIQLFVSLLDGDVINKRTKDKSGWHSWKQI